MPENRLVYLQYLLLLFLPREPRGPRPVHLAGNCTQLRGNRAAQEGAHQSAGAEERVVLGRRAGRPMARGTSQGWQAVVAHILPVQPPAERTVRDGVRPGAVVANAGQGAGEGGVGGRGVVQHVLSRLDDGGQGEAEGMNTCGGRSLQGGRRHPPAATITTTAVLKVTQLRVCGAAVQRQRLAGAGRGRCHDRARHCRGAGSLGR